MTTLFAPTALLSDGWADNVLIEYDAAGWIVGVDAGKSRLKTSSDAEMAAGPVIPGMSNCHSHAFQRAMAGLTERASGRKDTFWSWRDTMYRFLSYLEPEDIESLAAQTYIEMLKAGYTTVGEFHYIHHQPNGRPYPDCAVMSQHIVKAALETGIAMTVLPSLYAYGGFGSQLPAAGQKRFINGVSDIMAILESLHREFHNVPQVSLGFSHHSLRAVSPEMLHEGTQAVRRQFPDIPIHIHAAEQLREVEGCIEWSGKRPVEWLLENGKVDDRWCFIHCTHINEAEIKGLVKAGITVGLCPTTEANLGDGVFPMLEYFEAGGQFAIGSDSHISLNVMEELRWLEYVQRLVHQERTLIRKADIPSVGAVLYERAAQGGAHALGRKTGRIEVGYRADFVVLDSDIPCMMGKLRDHILDTAIFAASENPVRDVMSGGKWVIRERKHKREKQMLEKYRQVMKKLR